MAKGRIAINLEYAALCLLCTPLRAMPYGAAMGLADGLGWLLSCVFRFKRRRTLDRIRSVFPEKTSGECAFIARRSLQNFLRTVFEMVRATKLTRGWMDRHVADGARYTELLREVMSDGRGAVIMVPHSGNWYMAAWALATYGQRIFAIAARQRNPKIDAWMNRQYGAVDVLDRDNRRTLLQIRDRLRDGQAFAILPDLRVRDPDVLVDFLGGKANVSRAGATFAIKYGAPIVVAAMRRERGRHIFAHLATLRPEGRTAEDLTREVLGLLDGFIRQHPEDWFWYNKRWILEPV